MSDIITHKTNTWNKVICAKQTFYYNCIIVSRLICYFQPFLLSSNIISKSLYKLILRVEFRKGSTWSYLLIRCPNMHNKHSFRYYCCHFRQYERGFKEIMKKTKHQRSADYILGAKSLFVTIRMLCTVSFGTILSMFMTPTIIGLKGY